MTLKKIFDEDYDQWRKTQGENFGIQGNSQADPTVRDSVLEPGRKPTEGTESEIVPGGARKLSGEIDLNKRQT